MTLKRVSYASPNYSSRGGSGVRLIVVHTAQGAATASDLGAFFANPASGVSSHVGIDDTENTVWEYVRRDYKSWCAAAANPYSVQAELCAWAEWYPDTWTNDHPIMLASTAAWIAEEAAHYGIPIRKLTPAEAQDGHTAGVCGHVDLGVEGGNHWDPGEGFPWSAVLALAGGVTTTGEDDMPLNDDDKKWITDAINQALRQQFAPDGECFGRVLQADINAIQRTPANIPTK